MIIVAALYIALLFLISWASSKKLGSKSFFSADRKAPWPVVAYGMIGASISGVTFISVPGNVLTQNFYYLPMVLGFIVGYVMIAKILIPLYYKLELTSIYSYLGERFGGVSHITGSVVFMVSRVLGAAVRIFVVIIVLETFIPGRGVLRFALLAAAFLLLLYLYTFRAGVKTIIWTDVLQTSFMLLAVFVSIFLICKDLSWGVGDMFAAIFAADNPQIAGTKFADIFDWDWGHATNAIKQFVSGVFVTIAMTGLDQSMMQKNIACKDVKSAKKNMYTTALTIAIVNCFFLLLGAILSIYAESKGGMAALGIVKTDQLFPTIASQYLGVGTSIFFLVGLISASYPSAGAAMTSLTTSYCMDFLHFDERIDLDDRAKARIRKRVQAVIALVMLMIVLALYMVSNDAVINLIYKIASYTYGPLLGMFFFGILTKSKVKDVAVPIVALAAPLICLIINVVSKRLWGFDLGFSLLIVNGLLTFIGMWLIGLGKQEKCCIFAARNKKEVI